MAKSSISAAVAAANSKLAQFLRRQEEEEMILQIGKRKPKQECEEKRLPVGRARWYAAPDFRVPTCMVDRPRTPDGATSFHFSYISISKEAVPTLEGQPIEGFLVRKKQPALDHAKYIERDGAIEGSEGAKHADYIERPDAIEAVDPSDLVAEAIERQMAAVYNETPTEEEAALLGPHDIAPEGIPSVFSNISDDPFERQEYWRAIERTERQPRSHKLFFNPESSARWWAAVERSDTLNPTLKEHLLTVAEQYRQHLQHLTSNGESKEAFIPAAFPPSGKENRLTAEDAGKLIEQATSLPGFDYSQPPIEFKSGRGGRVQIRFVAELPHEVSAEDRALIVQNFCNRLANLETRVDPDGTERQVGMMYTAVIHAPDSHNDGRNYHLHIVAHDRPAKYLEEHGVWDFELEEYYESVRKVRRRFPHRQNKIGVVSQSTSRTGKQNSGQNFIPAMRRDFAKITNTVLQTRGVKRRYDPRRYTEMGIDRTPTEHMGTKASALEAIGVPTIVGQLNAIAIWNDAERNIERQARRADIAYKADQNRIERILQEAASKNSSPPAILELRKLAVERDRLTKSLAQDRRAIMVFDHMEAKAKSRAVRTRQTCLTYLSEIERGVADATTRTMKSSIQARFYDAQQHINKIDAALAPHRQVLIEAARAVERREARVETIDRLIDPLASDVRDQLQVTVEKEAKEETLATASQTSVMPPARHEVAEPKDRKKKARKDASSSPETKLVIGKGPDKPPALPEVDKGMRDDIASDNTPANAGPLTMEGLPITESTIQPAKYEMQPSAAKHGSAPSREDLEPLRPKIRADKKPVEPEKIILDIERSDKAEPIGTSTAKDKTPANPAKPTSPNVAPPEPAQTCNNSAQPSKADKSREKEPPDQGALVASGTKKSEHANWDALMNRIVKERIPIKGEETPSGKIRHTVPALNDEEQAILKIRRFSYRTEVRLESIYERQQQEIKRLARWVKEQGQDPEKLIVEGRTAKLGDVRPAVRTLMRNWGRHPDILSAVRAEHSRRAEAAMALTKKVEKNAPASVSTKNAKTDIAVLRERAEANYPSPDNVYTKAVADFVRLLRKVAPVAELSAAADKIYADPRAREDVYRYGANLATAYNRYVEDARQRDAHRHRGETGGRG